MKVLVATNVLIGVEFCYILQLDPLWPIALGLATVLYGPLNALLLSSQGFARLLVSRLGKFPQRARLVSFIFVLATVGLVIRNIYIVTAAEFLLAATSTTLMIILSGKIQDKLPSSQRSSVESAISTLSTIVFLLSTVLFMALTRRHSVFVASWILVGVAVLAAIGVQASLVRQRDVR